MDDPTPNNQLMVIPVSALAMDDKNKPYLPVQVDLTPAGAEAMPISKIQLPTLRVINPMSKILQQGVQGMKAGVLYNDVHGEIEETVQIIPLHIRFCRYMQVPGTVTDLACSSTDGFGKIGRPLKNPSEFNIPVQPTLVPMPDGTKQEFMCGNCLACPNKDWSNSPTGERQKPRCREVFWLYAVSAKALADTQRVYEQLSNPDEIGELLGSLVMMPFSSTGRKALDDMTNAAYYSGVLYGKVWEIGSMEKSGKGFKWWAFTANPIPNSKLTDEQRILANSLRILCSQINPSFKLESGGLFDEEDGIATPDIAGVKREESSID